MSLAGFARSMAEPREEELLAGEREAEALVLGSEPATEEDRQLTAVLDFFGVPWKSVTCPELARAASRQTASGAGWRVLAPATLLARAIGVGDDHGAEIPAWLGNADSIYVRDFADTEPCRRLLRLLTADSGAVIVPRAPASPNLTISPELREFCGPMSGLELAASVQRADRVFRLARRQTAQSIISGGGGDVLIATRWHGVACYLQASGEIVDLESRSAKYFDVRQNFCNCVPLVMYVKSALRDFCWRSEEINACVTVDDPPLKPRYGFLQFGELVELMRRNSFASSVAFIPWNWRRTDAETVALFRRNRDRLSLSVHGCDHTRAEFAERSPAILTERCRAALHRMNSLQWRTGLPYDNVMVYPQGVFSPESGRVLKLCGFDAAVNTEVSPAGGAANETRVRDLWDTAILRYGNFPIFTRRYISHGIENFAFDALLGKPCFIVAHHDTFQDKGRELAEFVGRLNGLNCKMKWRPLGEAIQGSYKVRLETNGEMAVRMFAESVRIGNSHREERKVSVSKLESDPGRVRQMTVNGEAVKFAMAGGWLRFETMLRPGEIARVQVRYVSDHAAAQVSRRGASLGYALRVMVRRHLSELRDHYVSLSKPWYPLPSRFRHG